jgi:hypothetical protein
MYILIYLFLATQTPETQTQKALRYIDRVTACCPKTQKRAAKVKHFTIAESIKRNLDPLLVFLIMFEESSFRPRAIGRSHGELGLMQVHGVAADGCELETPEGQIECGLNWLEKCYQKCKSTRGALYMYGTGECTQPKPNKRVEYRIKRYTKELEK